MNLTNADFCTFKRIQLYCNYATAMKCNKINQELW